MKLKSFGCSLIFGSELSDDGRDGPYATPSQQTWPALLAQHWGYDYECYARPGAGNLQILDRVLEHSVYSEPTIFLIGWSYNNRYDYRCDNRWRTILSHEETELARTYYQHLQSAYQDQLLGLTYIKLAIDQLKNKEHKFIMTTQDPDLFTTQSHSGITDLQNQIHPHLTWFEGMNFLQWSAYNKHKIGQNGHPLESAHRAAFEYISSTASRQ